MFEHIKEMRRLLGKLFEYGINISAEDRKVNFIQSLGPAWNGFIGVLEGSSKFESTLDRAQAEHIRREEQEARFGAKTGGMSKVGAAYVAAQGKKRKNPNIRCYYCQVRGHIASACRDADSPDPAAGGDVSSSAESASFRLAFAVAEVKRNCGRTWVVDSERPATRQGDVTICAMSRS